MMNMTSPRFRHVVVLSAGLLVALGGCAARQAALPHPGEADLLSQEAYPRIVVERGLHKLLVFGDAVVETSSELKPMKVSIPVRMKSDRAGANVQYQYFFVDAHGRTVSESGWRFERLPPRWQRDLTAASLDTGAVDFRLEVIRAR